MPEPLTLLTPTYLGDLARFQLLRESMRRFDVLLPHVAVVQTEDLPAFREAVGGEPGLTLVASADVLPTEAEAARRRGSGRGPRTPRALVVRALQELPGWTRTVSGWSAQQLVKLAAGRVVPGHWVCLDSDAFFVGPLDAQRFWAGDALVLNALDADVDYHPGPRRRSARLVGVDAPTPRRYYVDVPVPLHRDVVADLLGHVEQRTSRPWWQALVAARATEYMSYGLFAEHLDRPARVVPRRLDLSRLLYDVDATSLEAALRAVVEEGASLAMVHSRLAVQPADVAAAARRVWAA